MLSVATCVRDYSFPPPPCRRSSSARIRRTSWMAMREALSTSRLYNQTVLNDLSRGAARLSIDTTIEIEQRQIAALRRMSATERAELMTTTTRAVLDLALAGIRLRHPDAGDRECLLRLAVVRLGPSVAASIYPDLRQLPDFSGDQPD